MVGSVVAAVLALAACGSSPGAPSPATLLPAASSATGSPTDSATGTPPEAPSPTQAPPATSPRTAPAAATGPAAPARGAGPAPAGTRPGPAAGNADVPAAARAVDTSRPTRVIGRGTPASCTSDAVVAAVAAGGVVTFDCGPTPVTITLTHTAKVVNSHPDLVLDGGGTVTLSGGGARRILYQNTCDQAQTWTTAHCDDQETPRLVVQNLTLSGGDSTAEREGGGALFVRGGQVRIVNSRFVGNRCQATGPDVGGAAVRVLDQYRDRPVSVVGSTFTGGVCANGGGISSIGVSWVVLDSVFDHNRAIGHGANPARSGTVGGGSGGAIYLDGNAISLTLSGTRVQDNQAEEGGGAIFFVSNDRTGTLTLTGSTLARNPNRGFQTAGLPGIFFLGARPPAVTAGTRLS